MSTSRNGSNDPPSKRRPTRIFRAISRRLRLKPPPSTCRSKAGSPRRSLAAICASVRIRSGCCRSQDLSLAYRLWHGAWPEIPRRQGRMVSQPRRGLRTASPPLASAVRACPVRATASGDNTANTNVIDMGGRTYSIVEAGGLPVELTLHPRECRSALRPFRSTLKHGFTAHPKIDRVHGHELHAVAYQPGLEAISYLVVDRAGRARPVADIPARHTAR